MSSKLLDLPNFYRDYLLNLNKKLTLLLLVIAPITYQGVAMDSYHSPQIVELSTCFKIEGPINLYHAERHILSEPNMELSSLERVCPSVNSQGNRNVCQKRYGPPRKAQLKF